MKKIYQILGLILVVLVLTISSYFVGKNSGKHSVEYVTETVLKYDTVTKVIKEPYKVIEECISYVELPQKIDTVFVIKEFYSKHFIEREFKDSNIVITVKDTLFKNDILSGNIEYKWLQPKTVINKSSITTNYYKYISLGLNTTTQFNSFGLDVMYHTKQYYYKVGYNPQLKQTSIGIGTTIFKFK